jgi:hypothetical protein
LAYEGHDWLSHFSVELEDMAFFSAEKLKRRQIEIDHSAITCDSPNVQKRLSRIDANYQQLDSMLSDIEETISGDQRLSEINASIKTVDIAKKKKRKWRPNKPR